MFREDRLCAELKKLGMSKYELAEHLGMHKVSLYRKIRGGSEFCRDEIQKCRELFGKEAADEIFFSED